MCVAIRFASSDGCMYLARNLDGSNPMGEHPLVLPAGYPLEWQHVGCRETRHAVVGAGHVFKGKLILHEACNDAGLAVAGLALPKSTHDADTPMEGKVNISRYEFPSWLAANFGSLEQVEEALADTVVVSPLFGSDITFNPFPMHWLVADSTGSLVVESTERGLVMYDDDVDVLTNEPAFPVQRARLQGFVDAHPDGAPEALRRPAGWDPEVLRRTAAGTGDGVSWEHGEELGRRADGMGYVPTGFDSGGGVRDGRAGERGATCDLGAQEIPGDYSPSSRFIKAAYVNALYPVQESEHANVVRAFRTLESVAVPMGSVPAAGGRLKTTLYRCVFSSRTGTYYHAAYDDLSVAEFHLADAGQEG